MKEIDEIQKLIDRVVFNELVERAKQIISTPKLSDKKLLMKDLKQNLAYLENPILYEAIEDALKSDPAKTEEIEGQVERNKITLETVLSPEIEVDNIITLRALKSMHEDKVKQRADVCTQLTKLKHLSYIVKADDYLEKCYSGNASEDEINKRDEIRGEDPIVYDSVKAIHKAGERSKMQNMLHSKSRKYLKALKEGLNAFGDKDNRDKIDTILENEESKRTKKVINDYNDIKVDLESKYKPKHVNHTRLDEHIIRIGDELRGKYYGPDAITYVGRSKSLIVRQNIFQRAVDRIKRVFSRKDYEEFDDDRSEIGAAINGNTFVEPKDIYAQSEEFSDRRNDISPKVKVIKVKPRRTTGREHTSSEERDM